MAKLLKERTLLAIVNGVQYQVYADEYATLFYIGVKRTGWALPCVLDYTLRKRKMGGKSIDEWVEENLAALLKEYGE